MKTKEYTQFEKGMVVGMWRHGAVHQEIADELDIPRRSVTTIIAAYRDRGNTLRPTTPTKPRKLSERDVRSLVRCTKRDRRAPLAEIAQNLPVKVSEATVRRALHAESIFSRIAVKKPFLSATHQERRLAFARKLKNWTIDDWSTIMWTDEASFEIGHNSRTVRVWRTSYETYNRDCLVPTFKSGRTSVMVWGAFCGTQKSQLVFMPKGRRTATDFVEIVYEGELSRFREDVPWAILMEDGAPIHRSNAPKFWREENGLDKLDWPANSPDLNPIENVWFVLKDRVQHRRERPRTDEQMNGALQEEWETISSDFLQKLVQSMPARIAAVIEARGGHCRW